VSLFAESLGNVPDLGQTWVTSRRGVGQMKRSYLKPVLSGIELTAETNFAENCKQFNGPGPASGYSEVPVCYTQIGSRVCACWQPGS
jgi:hypothetical protein